AAARPGVGVVGNEADVVAQQPQGLGRLALGLRPCGLLEEVARVAPDLEGVDKVDGGAEQDGEQQQHQQGAAVDGARRLAVAGVALVEARYVAVLNAADSPVPGGETTWVMGLASSR